MNTLLKRLTAIAAFIIPMHFPILAAPCAIVFAVCMVDFADNCIPRKAA